MLAEAIMRIGRPVKNSNLSNRERIRLLTDVSSVNCKNYFKNVFIVELNSEQDIFHHVQVGNPDKTGKKETFMVDQRRNTSFPIFYPNGGNPLHAQGIYPLPFYLLYDPHIKAISEKEKFEKAVLLPRINSTIGYQDKTNEEKENLAARVAKLLEKESVEFVTEAKQLGILMIFDKSLSVYKRLESKVQDESLLWVGSSGLNSNEHLYLVGEEVLKSISQAKFAEASELGRKENAVSTFSNNKEKEVVSIYNKSWLWLSPTWEMPRSIYWKGDEWTKGIKVDFESYVAFLYGVQLLKELQVPISSSILKEMFAPISSVEAKKHMKPTSFEPVFGIPMVLPLLDKDSDQLFHKFRKMLKKDEISSSDLHLEVLAGMRGSILPETSDEHRLNIIYYSGDLSRGNMHIRAVIEDVIPSVASQIQDILRKLKFKELKKIQAVFGIEQPQPVYRTENLPSLLANAFGPGYLWESLQAVLHREPLRIMRLRAATTRKLNELANKESYWEMKHELIFYYSFVFFLKQYEDVILAKKGKGGVKELADWETFIEQYHQGNISSEDLKTVESIGFASGLLLKQFSNSYYKKTNKDFVKHRVMKFGSRLTPEMIWKNGLLRCEELAQQWDMGLASNFRPVLGVVLQGLLAVQKSKKLVSEKDEFLTAFWSGYLVYQKNKEDLN